MNIELLPLKPHSTILITLDSTNIPDCYKDKFGNHMAKEFRDGISDRTIQVLVIWDSSIKNITVIEPTE
jgi:hypothetical protein